MVCLIAIGAKNSDANRGVAAIFIPRCYIAGVRNVRVVKRFSSAIVAEFVISHCHFHRLPDDAVDDPALISMSASVTGSEPQAERKRMRWIRRVIGTTPIMRICDDP